MESLLIILPLLSAIYCGVFQYKFSKQNINIVSTFLLASSWVLSCVVLVGIFFDHEIHHETLINWVNIGRININWAFYIDQLTALMFFVVTTISTVVHLYSIGYMAEDKNSSRFMSYLGLFTFAMLVLVCADNFIQMFFGWEGVGVCSYLLIGFWYKKDSANMAAMKAFITNRVGDFALILGVFLIWIYTGSFDFLTIFAKKDILLGEAIGFAGFEMPVIDIICLLLFIGCMGKSAQIGLHVWLPDAMEGPTPVSALIHAATMVTAGVFLVARCSYLFEYSPIVMNFIIYIGAITALLAAVIGSMQSDIKKIIAYSTCSQLGYMFIACGIGAYQVAIFHLFTHAFFKALLFLAAGNVIHAMSHEQDIFKMGNLRKKLPFTYASFWIGSLALAGIWPFAGYYSKDAILEFAESTGSFSGEFAFMCGILAAFLTAFYSWRLIILVFHGEETNNSKFIIDSIHEAPKIMTYPLVILMIGAVSFGFSGEYVGMVKPPYLGFFQSSILNLENIVTDLVESLPWWEKSIPIIISFIGIASAYLGYMFGMGGKVYFLIRPIYEIVENGFYVNEIYNYILVRGLKLKASMFAYIDKKIIDFVPNSFALFVQNMGLCLRSFQTGYIFDYAYIMIAAVALIIAFSVNIIIFGG